MKTVSILIPAWRAEKYILQCVDSVHKQKPVKGWTYNLHIAVDACPATASVLQKNKIPFHWSEKNVGPYVLRNSLIQLDAADAYAYFDADDVMLPEYLSRCIDMFSRGFDVCMAKKYNCDESLTSRTPCIEKGGAITFTHKALEAVGGFCAERCASDTDFMERLYMAGFQIPEVFGSPLYLRRKQPNGITRLPETGYGSQARKQAWTRMTKDREAGKIKIDPVCIKFTDCPDFTKSLPVQKNRKRIMI